MANVIRIDSGLAKYGAQLAAPAASELPPQVNVGQIDGLRQGGDGGRLLEPAPAAGLAIGG